MAVKGERQVGAITSSERGKLVIILCAMNDAGDFDRSNVQPTKLLKMSGPMKVYSMNEFSTLPSTQSVNLMTSCYWL